METRPHPLIERSVSVLFPPLPREAVMGDLSERYRTPGRYLLEAFSVLPMVIAGQIRRTTTIAAFGVQALIIFGCMGGFGELSAPDSDVPAWARAGVPALAALLTLIFRDAYRRADGWSAPRAARDVGAVALTVVICQLAAALLATLAVVSPDWVFMAQRMVVMALSILPTLFVFRLGLGLDGDSRLQEPSGAMSAAELRADYARFRARVRTRNLLEMLIYGGMAVAGALFLLLAQGMNVSFHWLWPAGQALVCWYLATQASARAMPELASFTSLIAFYRGEIARQRRLVRFIWWWYLWPLCLGVGLPSLARAADSIAFAGLGLACIALVAGFVARFSSERARDFQEEMDVLSVVQERP